MPLVKAALEAADGDELAAALERDGKVTVSVDGEPIELAGAELEVRLVEKAGLATAGDRELLVALDIALTPELVAAGWAREVVNRIQTARKEAGLAYTDRIRVRYHAAEALWQPIVAQRLDAWIREQTLAVELAPSGVAGDLAPAAIDEHDFAFAIEKAG